jgi:predicted O-methyltransferase YrrM
METTPPSEPVFSQEWSQHFIANSERHLVPLAGRPLRYLEIGVFEGCSSLWMLTHVLTHPDCHMVGIDAWPVPTDPYEERARANLAPESHRVELIKGYSKDALRDPRLEPDSFDIIYIDGDHSALGVLTDSTLCWPLLKVGGICIWDDYGWRRALWKRLPSHMRPAAAIDAFRSAVVDESELLFRNYQVGLRKTEAPEQAWR